MWPSQPHSIIDVSVQVTLEDIELVLTGVAHHHFPICMWEIGTWASTNQGDEEPELPIPLVALSATGVHHSCPSLSTRLAFAREQTSTVIHSLARMRPMSAPSRE